MRKIYQFLFWVLASVLIVSIWSFVSANTYTQNKKDFTRLNAHEVLEILAHPLPDNSSKGYYLPNADISNVNLTGVNFRLALLSYSDLSGSLLLNADFSNASAQEVNFSHSSLSNANLSGTWLLAANFEDATVVYSKLNGANLEDANLRNADFSSSSLVKVNLKGADLTNTDFTGAIMEGVTLPNGKLHQEGDDLVSLFGAKNNP